LSDDLVDDFGGEKGFQREKVGFHCSQDHYYSEKADVSLMIFEQSLERAYGVRDVGLGSNVLDVAEDGFRDAHLCLATDLGLSYYREGAMAVVCNASEMQSLEAAEPSAPHDD
jgi:hypothetical protein